MLEEKKSAGGRENDTGVICGALSAFPCCCFRHHPSFYFFSRPLHALWSHGIRVSKMKMYMMLKGPHI